MISRLFMLGFVLAVINACSLGGVSQGQDARADSVLSQTVSVENDTLNLILSHYLDVKDALVASEVEQAALAALDLAESLESIEGCQTTAQLAEQINSQQDIGQQRADFAIVSQDLIAMFQHVQVRSGALYVTHCPMYNDQQGADWISASKEIENPYYGDKMLSCGKVVQTLD